MLYFFTPYYRKEVKAMLTLLLLVLLVLILFAALLVMTGLVVIWPITVALIIMICSDVALIRKIIKRD